jgi:hypothetical protein
MKLSLLPLLVVGIATIVPLPVRAEDNAKTATFRGAGVTLEAPGAKIHDYVLVVEGDPGVKHSFRIDRETTKILDPNDKVLKDSWTAVSAALNQSVEVTYTPGKTEPYSAITVKCLEQ